MSDGIKANECRYPKDVYSAFSSIPVRSGDGKTITKTFSVRGELVEAQAKKGHSPYKVYDGTFSRFVFTIVKKTPGMPTTFPDANIGVDEIPGLIQMTKAAMNTEMLLTQPVVGQLFGLIKKEINLGEQALCGLQNLFYFMKHGKLKEKKDASSQPEIGKLAKSVEIKMGNMKGKTPYQVLAENPAGRSLLESQYEFLAKNAEKYPANREQMAAIKEAITMLERGMIGDSDDSAENGTEPAFGNVILYAATPRALIRKKDKETGLCPVYELDIAWHIGDRYPVEVCITNYKAPVISRENGTINPEKSKAVDQVQERFRMTSTQWFDCLYRMQAHMGRFEMLTASKQFKDAAEADRVNRTAQAEAEQIKKAAEAEWVEQAETEANRVNRASAVEAERVNKVTVFEPERAKIAG